MICLHPGEAPLTERADIMASWRGILKHPQSPKVRCTDELVIGRPGLALVMCREILAEGQLMATNSFVRLGDGWRMVGHHSGQVPVVDRPRPVPTAATAAAPRDRRKLH
jgi:hypothetical protein